VGGAIRTPDRDPSRRHRGGTGGTPWRHVTGSPDALLFGTSSAGYLARSNWNSTFRRAADAVGLPTVRPHELRHTGATLAAATGASTKELMRRLGHSSPAAALLYQHAADDRDVEIARALEATVSAASVR
jgi:integrase